MKQNFLVCVLFSCFCICLAIFSPTIEIYQGKLRGIIKKDWKGGEYYSFLSIPYAKKPIGNLRFMIPSWAEKWEGLRDAVNDMPECLQKNLQGSIIGQEDCLYLNVHTSELGTNNSKPVMVYIHGGGYVEGSGRMFGAEFLMPEDIVLVTINYRLGLFGFLNFENPDVGAFGNMGLKDQNMALRWVQKNIEIFGGNPKSVTIFGESAGAASVHMHMLSPMSKGLFHRVIAQSGSALNPWNTNGQKNTGVLAARILGFNGTSEIKMLPFLQNVSVEDIFKIQENCSIIVPIHEQSIIGPVIETIDDELSFLPRHPEEIISAKTFEELPFMIGFTDVEAMTMDVISLLKTGDIAELLTESTLLHTLNIKDDESKQDVINKINKFYYNDHLNIDKANVYNHAGDAWIYWGVYNSVIAHSKISHKDLYYYVFAADTELNYMKRFHPITASYPGASHLDDLSYLFKTKYTPEIKPESIEAKSIDRVVKLWTNFAKYGNPTPKREEFGVIWEPVKNDKLNCLHIGTRNLELDVNPYAERMAFWEHLHEEFAFEKKNVHTEL